jgi:hypothetical protein
MEWWSNGVVEWWNNELSPGTQKGCNTLRVERTKRLEGSRFVAWQLYGLVAGRLPGTSRGVAVLWAVLSAAR